jgi:hypothetical protein
MTVSTRNGESFTLIKHQPSHQRLANSFQTGDSRTTKISTSSLLYHQEDIFPSLITIKLLSRPLMDQTVKNGSSTMPRDQLPPDKTTKLWPINQITTEPQHSQASVKTNGKETSSSLVLTSSMLKDLFLMSLKERILKHRMFSHTRSITVSTKSGRSFTSMR